LTTKFSPLRVFRTALLLAGVAVASAPVRGQQSLPDAPSINAPAAVPVPATRSNTPAGVERRQWSGIVEPGEIIPPLDTEDKLLFPLHEEARPITIVPILISGFDGAWRNTDPHYGTDSAGVAERMAAAALRQASIRVFSDGLLPAVFHEDPRYYRRGVGSFGARSFYAVSRVFVTQRDSGKRSFDISNTLGRGMAAALTQTYYPEASMTKRVVFQTWSISLGGLGGIYVFEEFLPDLKRSLLHHAD
jgi:hypothetical protein